MPNRRNIFFDANMASLKKFQPNAWQTANEVFKTINLASEPMPAPISPENHAQIAEIEQYLAPIPADTAGVVVLLGMGTGYLPEAILSRRPQLQHLVIFELQTANFLEAMATRDLTDILHDPRTILCLGPTPNVHQTLSAATLSLYLESFHTIRHLPSITQDTDGYEKVRAQVFEYGSMLQTEGKTLTLHGRTFLANRLANLSSMPHQDLLENLQGRLAGIPAILVAAGPSLDQNIEQLRAARGKAAIFAVDTALPALLAREITPNFVSAIDAQAFAYEKIADLAPQSRDIALLCMPWAHPRFAKTFPALKVYWAFAQDNPVDQWLKEMLGARLSVDGATTVAHLNLIAALVMGCSPIIFTGQDLAFTGHSSHTAHTVLTYNNPQNSPPGKYIQTRGINGAEVTTHPTFYAMKRHFERIMAKHPGHYINASAAGVDLEGTEVLPLDTAIARHCRMPALLTALHTPPQPATPPSSSALLVRLQETQTALATASDQVSRAKRAIVRSQKEMKKTRKQINRATTFQQLPPPTQKVIQEMDKACGKTDAAQAIWPLLDEISLAGLKQSERLRHAATRLAGNQDRYAEMLDLHVNRLACFQETRHEALDFFNRLCTQAIAHLEAEQRLRNKLAEPAPGPEILSRLANLYFMADDFNLLQPLAKQLASARPDDGEAVFYCAVSAAWQAQHAEAETLFTKAQALNPDLRQPISRFRRAWGAEYLAFARRYQGQALSHRRLLLKGLRHCHDDEQLSHAVNKLFANDMAAATGDDCGPDITSILRLWGLALHDQPEFRHLLSPEQRLALHLAYGKSLLATGAPQKAAEEFKAAIELNPQNPDTHVLATDALFAAGDINQGISHLNRAVALDRNYARFWEEIGDDLYQAGQYRDSLAAFEQCFIALPEQFGLLKKIGLCYQNLGEHEAASEALRQYTEKQTGHG